MAGTLMNEYPEVEVATRVRRFSRDRLVRRGDQQFQEKRVFSADSTFFNVFSFPLIAVEGRAKADLFILWTLMVGYNYIETLDIEMLAGRSFSRDFSTDGTAYIINEAAAAKLGLDNPLENRLIESGPQNQRIGPIIGVVKDFHFESLHEDIKPMVFRLRQRPRFITVRVHPVGWPFSSPF